MNTADLDRTLAFTAILEMWPDPLHRMTDEEAAPLRAELAAAMTAASPRDRWAFARQWIADKRVEQADAQQHGGSYGLPWPGDMNYETAVAIARSAHPSRVLAITAVYRYGRFEEMKDHQGRPFVSVTMMGNQIARFYPEGVQLSWAGRVTQSSAEALGNLVSGGYFYRNKGVMMFSRYETTGTQRTGTPAKDYDMYHYHRTPAGTCPGCGCQTGGNS